MLSVLSAATRCLMVTPLCQLWGSGQVCEGEWSRDNIRNGHPVSQCQGMSPPGSNIMCSHQRYQLIGRTFIRSLMYEVGYIYNKEEPHSTSECLMLWCGHCTSQCGKMRFIAAVLSSRHVVSWQPDSRCRLVSLDTLNKSWDYTLCCGQWQNMISHPHYTIHCTLMYELILNASNIIIVVAS